MILLKSLIITTGLLGLIILLGENLNWFRNKDRIDFYNKISKDLECSPYHDGAKIFLKHYFYTMPMSEEERNIEIEKIIFVGTFTKGQFPDGTKTKNIVSGTIKVRNVNGFTTKGLCDYSELSIWAKGTAIWKWVAWSLLVISFISQVCIFYIEIFMKNA